MAFVTHHSTATTTTKILQSRNSVVPTITMMSIQPGSLPPQRVCSSCGQAEGEHRLKTCAKCNTVLYCSRDCQTAHWKVHKKECRKPNSDTNQQPSKTPILGPWDEKLYKPTTPLSFLRGKGKPTPEVGVHFLLNGRFSIFVLTCVLGGQGNVRRAA